MISRMMRVLLSAVVPTVLALALCGSQAAAASPAQLILKAQDVPGWHHLFSSPFSSRDLIQAIDVKYPRGPRPLDGYIASFSKTHMGLRVFVAKTANATAAKLVVRHSRAEKASPTQPVALGSGGWYGEDTGGIKSGSNVIWSSGAYVLAVGLDMLGPKPGLTKAQMVALAHIMQRRAG